MDILFIIVNIIQDSKIIDQNRKKKKRQEIISSCRSWAKTRVGGGRGAKLIKLLKKKRVELCELAYLALNSSHD